MNNLGFAMEDTIEQDLFLETDVTKNDAADTNERKFKIIKIVFYIFCFLLLVEFAVYKYILPSMKSPKVSISGVEMYSPEEIAGKLVTMNASNWFTFDQNEAAAILSSEAGIEKVIVEKRFPEKINIHITERTPVAVTFISENGKTIPMNVDKEGFLFPCRNSVDDKKTIPIISGLPVEYMASGRRIPAKYRPLIDQIYDIRDLSPSYFATISEICVLSKEYGNYELALIPSQSKVKVLTDRALNEDALKYMMIVLDVVNQIGTDVAEVDLRYGSVSYRTK